MSTSLIIGLAFFVGFFLSYKMLRKIIKSVLNKRRSKSKFLSKNADIFKKDMCVYINDLFKEFHDLNIKVNDMLNDAYNKATNITESGKQELNKELESNINSNIKQASNKITKAVRDFKMSSTSVAADTVKQIMHEYKGNKRSSEIIASFSRDLNKKLH